MEGWFGHVESRFWAKVVFEKWDRFDHTVVALSKEVIQLGFNAVAHLDDNQPFSKLGRPNSNDLRKGFSTLPTLWAEGSILGANNSFFIVKILRK
jgi:hypothetical protein